jgi:hypothetical protein
MSKDLTINNVVDYLLKNEEKIIEKKINSFIVSDIKKTKIISVPYLNGIMSDILCNFILKINAPKKFLILHSFNSKTEKYFKEHINDYVKKIKSSYHINIFTYQKFIKSITSKNFDEQISIVFANYDTIKKITGTNYCSSQEINEIVLNGSKFDYKISLLEESFLNRILQLEDIINSNNQLDNLSYEDRFTYLFTNPLLNLHYYKNECLKFHYSSAEILDQVSHKFLMTGLQQTYIKEQTIQNIFNMLSDLFKLIHLMINNIPIGNTENNSNILMFYNTIPPFNRYSDMMKISEYRQTILDDEKKKIFDNQLKLHFSKAVPDPTYKVLETLINIASEKNQNNINILLNLLFNMLVKIPIDCNQDFIIMNFN